MQSVTDYVFENLKATRESMAKYYDRKYPPEPEYKVGDLVILDAQNIKSKRPTCKLAPKSYGPFPVLRVGTSTCTMDLAARWNIFPVFHVSLLEPYCRSVRPSRKQERPPPEDIEGELEYEVEEIIGSKKQSSGKRARKQQRVIYLIKWLGYPENECSWELVEVIEGSAKLIQSVDHAFPDMPKQ